MIPGLKKVIDSEGGADDMDAETDGDDQGLNPELSINLTFGAADMVN